MKTNPNDKIQALLAYIQRLNNNLVNPSHRHDNPVKLQEYKNWVSREIKKAQKTIDSLRG